MALTKQEIAILDALVQKLRGDDARTIAAAYGSNISAVYNAKSILIGAGIDLPTGRSIRIDRAELTALVEAGVKTSEIAAHFETAASCISRLKKELGIHGRLPTVSDVLSARKAAE